MDEVNEIAILLEQVMDLKGGEHREPDNKDIHGLE